MIRGIYKKLFAEFFFSKSSIGRFRCPEPKACSLESPTGFAVSEMAMPFLRSMSFILSSPAQSLTFMLEYINVYEEKNAEET